ncbi:glycosyltransferase [Roseospirillum parvum]|uniref:Glycosyl transferase family 2 n=1 Tax=Roseospirillum parvum TaxID=83401 RepID=A0A1G7TW60_9PROT|nr:glycosyltransferase [Roseospirillum parvum]SDG39274.1 Glycosyl transferase family 2 [Roseospirillum parvum]
MTNELTNELTAELTDDSLPLVTIIMIDGRFRERFDTIDNVAALDYPTDRYEALWIDYFEVAGEAARRAAPHPHVEAISLGHQGVYHSSYCFNAGIARARGEILVILDADVMVEADFLRQVVASHAACPDLAMYIRRLDQPQNRYVPGSESDLDLLRRTCALVDPSNFGGCLTVRKRWMEALNGYEQHFIFGTGFHANGRDVNVRLKNLGLCVKWHPELVLYHAWHPLTLTPNPIHDIQKKLIRWRELHLNTRAFVGLARQTTPLPPALEAEILADVARHGL